jgi:hypothetical protein
VFEACGLTHGKEVFKEIVNQLARAGWIVETPFMLVDGYALVIKHPWTPKGKTLRHVIIEEVLSNWPERGEEYKVNVTDEVDVELKKEIPALIAMGLNVSCVGKDSYMEVTVTNPQGLARPC